MSDKLAVIYGSFCSFTKWSQRDTLNRQHRGPSCPLSLSELTTHIVYYVVLSFSQKETLVCPPHKCQMNWRRSRSVLLLHRIESARQAEPPHMHMERFSCTRSLKNRCNALPFSRVVELWCVLHITPHEPERNLETTVSYAYST